MSASVSIDPAAVAEKAAELRALYGGRELIRPKELAALLGLSRMFMWRLARKGAFVRETRISPRAVFYSVSDVAAFLLRSRQPVPQPVIGPKKTGRPRKRRRA
jgi:predicted DNA-binding transcriptional regulator AlpA